ncbi:MAG: aminotransferase class III-fold pyridoxal phosphate-dependent enzyme [Desulfobacterales bacterium]|nr:aminotransferase class III-fold pyridoxal phosphate-dependent enzyme [Desulfobacterales bacterium]
MVKTFVEYGDLDGLKKAVDNDTAGVIVEPIQGEAGVIIPPDSFLEGIREICDKTGALMIADEVQTGMGRTGKWLAMQHTKVKPDIVTLAKGIASGFPMGALVAREDLEFKKSEHGSTFAGGPLACAAALATIGVIEKILPDVSRKGERFAKGLADIQPPCPRADDRYDHRGQMPGDPEEMCRTGCAGQLCSGREPASGAPAGYHRC